MFGYLFSIVAGAFGGYLLHAVSMKVNFRQRTIENKTKVYDAIISLWARMRNFIFHELMTRRHSPNVMMEFDKLYGESQTFMGHMGQVRNLRNYCAISQRGSEGVNGALIRYDQEMQSAAGRIFFDGTKPY